MRPLVMDFPGQPALRDVWDQYMFGPAFLVCPVTEYQARSRNVVLPASSGGFYDFWTGEAVAGGQSLDADAPYDELPLFVPAGSIVPVGPELQYTDEVAADPIVLWVYGGADGRFTLYEDDGLSYGYETGEFSEIDLSWDDASSTLSVADRRGSYPGMLAQRTFIVVRVGPGNAVGFDVDVNPSGTELSYDGTATSVVVP
jgi:alpha-D-xyloside xylohydrolase